jgi:hypothetical protein
MSRVNDLYDDLFPEDADLPVNHWDRKLSSGKKRLKARRKIEDIREKKRLRRQLDPYSTDY